MKHEKIAQALDEVRDEYIAEAAAKPKRKWKNHILRLTAAMVTIAVLLAVFTAKPVAASAVSLPGEVRGSGNYNDAKAAAAYLSDFFAQGTEQFLTGQENAVWSPVNAFVGLAMVAELTEGNSRQQILDLFGVEDIEALRTLVADIWEYVYLEGEECATLANSLWLSDKLSYEQEAMDNLAYYYYASVYKGEMGSDSLNTAIRNWINQNTGDLLKDATDGIKLDKDTVLALYSTLYLQGTWQSEFNEENNTKDVFHGYSGDTTVTYMNKSSFSTTYYWADNFSAVALGMKNGTTMWFILPDEGYTVADILASDAYMQMVTGDWENKGRYRVNLSVPKFDISHSIDLKQGLQELGVTDIFTNAADFSAIMGSRKLAVSSVRQNARAVIDEEGVKAAAYIEIPLEGSFMPIDPEEEVDFVVDRPFVFVISKANLPLFVGTVIEP